MRAYSSRIGELLGHRALAGAIPVLLGLLAAPAGAGEITEHDYFSDLPVILSVSRLAQPLDEVPGAVTVIDAETIRRSGAREVADLLRLVPGFLVTERNGGSTIAAYHAALDLYGARMQVYVDGRSVYSSYYLGDTHRGLAAVELADVERIEVLRGSNSAAFGSNAFLGLINIITRAAADTAGVSVAVTKGDHGIDDNFARFGWGNEAANMRVSVSRRSTTGNESLYDDSRRSQLQFRGDFRISQVDDLRVQLGVAREAFGEGFAGVACPPPAQPRAHSTLLGPGLCDEDPQRSDYWRNGYARFDWSRTLGESSSLRVAGGLDQELYLSSILARQYPNRLPVVISAPLDASGKALRQNLEIQRTDSWQNDLRTVVGAEILREEVRAPFLFSAANSISDSQWRLFGSVEWKPAVDWVINGGGMWEKHSMTGSNFAPRLAVNYHVTDNQTLRALTTQSFRMPSLYMLRGVASLPVTATLLVPPYTTSSLGSQPYAAASGQVKPESVISNEVGYLGEFSRLGLRVDVRAFIERVNHRHWIVSGDTVNMAGPRIHGIEYQFDWRPFAATRVVFAEAQVREEPGRDAIAEHYEAPHRSGSLALYQKLPGGFDLSLMHYHLTPYQWSTSVLDASRRLDVRLAYAFRVGATKGELAVMVRSPGGSLMEFTPTQLTGRSAFTSLKLDF